MAAVSLVVALMVLLVAVFLEWDGMLLELERVSDPLAACVSHEDSNTTIVICGMQ
jgi:hypothetical protein